MENFDLVKLLKMCPPGVKLYSTIFGEVELLKIDESKDSPIAYQVTYPRIVDYVDRFGRVHPRGECTIFPSKDQRDWSKWRSFTDGDIIASPNSICIFKSQPLEGVIDFYCSVVFGEFIIRDYTNNYDMSYMGNINQYYPATDDQVDKFLNIIKDNGYEWDPQNKCLNQLVRDLISNDSSDWVKINNPQNYSISSTVEVSYVDKFNLETLTTFDQILVRDNEDQPWQADHFYCIEGDRVNGINCIGWKYCIPYNEDTKHLVNKNLDAPEFYRYWD